jgi:hypothetical protein
MAIVNFKNIFTSGFDQDALTTDTSGDHIFNFGRLTTTGDLANDIFADANGVSIRNFAHVETNGLGAAGIFVQGDNAHIENYGSITTNGSFFDPGVGEAFFSDAMTVFGDRFYIANFGSVQVAGDFSSGMSGIGNDGIVVNYGHVQSLAFASAVLAVVGDRSQVINAGDVTASGDFTSAMLVLGDSAVGINLGKILVAGVASDGIEANGGTDQVVTNKGVIEMTADESFGMSASGAGDHINNLGSIKTHGFFDLGITTRSQDVEVVNTGHITTAGDLAIGVAVGVTSAGFRPAANGTVDNHGVIETEGDGAAGVVLVGDGHHLINSGRITTDGGAVNEVPLGPFRAAGVVVSGNGTLLENTHSGVIESNNAGSAAVELNIVERNGLSVADTSSTLDNSGFIKAPAVAVLGGAGQETVVNHGHIVGDVVLGDGTDTFVFGKGGTLAGNLFLGGGDDLVRIEKGSGTAYIADFVAGAASNDVIDVANFFSSFADLTAHSHQSGNDVVINLDHHDQLILAGVHLNALNAGDFIV